MNKVRFVQNFVNRNPRNLEKLRLQRKPSGWIFEKNRATRNCIYRVDLQLTKNNTTAHVVHYEDGVVLSASTREKSVSSQLLSRSDVCAATNIGRLLAERCKMSGIVNVNADTESEEAKRSQRRMSFFNTLQENGITLSEEPTIAHTHNNDPQLVWDRFPVKNTRETKLDELDLSLEPGEGVC